MNISYQLIITLPKREPATSRVLRKKSNKFFEGVIQSFELRMAQMQLYSAQNNYVTAIQSVINKKTVLETLLNKTL